MLDVIPASRIHDVDDELPAGGGSAAKSVVIETEAAFDPHASKVPPDAPGLAIKRAGGRLLRKGPIGALVVGTLVIAVVAAAKGLDSAGAGIAAAGTPQPVDPQAPTAPNLEVSDLVKNAPGNNAPVLIPKMKQAAALSGPPSPPAGPGHPPAAEPIPDLSRPPPGGGPPAGGGPGGAAGNYAMAGPTAAQEARRAAREARMAERDQALVADMVPNGEGVDGAESAAAGRTGGRPPGAPAMPMPAGFGVPPGMPPGFGGPGGGAMPAAAAPGGNPDNPGQAQKNAFLSDETKGTQAERGYTVLRQPVSPYRMRAGWVIPCALQGTINSDLPGMVFARVTENVYDSVTGTHLLVPQGATVSGPANSAVAYGQERAQFCWTLLERDDGVSIDLGCSPAYDRSGSAGIEGEVNNHYGKLITGVVLSAMLGAVTQTVAGDMQNYRPSVTQGFALGAANEFGSAGQQITRRNLNIQPTLTAKAASEVVVLLEKPVIIPPYKQP
jgi:type IV secretion system protein TrbI